VSGSSDGFTTGDVNGDGKLDIVGHYTTYTSGFGGGCGSTVSPIANALVLFAGNGAGSFTQEALAIPIGNTATDPIVSLKTIELGGKTDLIVTLATELIVFERNAAGVWQDIYRTSGSFSNLVIGDLNGDGIADIIASSSGTKIQMLFGNTTGSFSSQIFDPLDTNLKDINYLNLADINDDSKLDLITGYTRITSNYDPITNSLTYPENSFAVKVYDADASGNLSQLGTTKVINDRN
jgi:hypothetical protein